MFLNMTIKARLWLLLSISIIGVLILSIFLNISISNISALYNANINLHKLNSEMLTLRKHEKDFMLRKNLKYTQKHKAVVSKLRDLLKETTSILTNYDIDISRLNQFDQNIKQYAALFSRFTNKQKEIGLNPKDGLYGSLRDSVHKAQNVAKQEKDYKVLSYVYELRKHEKDFMLRRDMKYIDKFNKSYTKLITLLNTKNQSVLKPSLEKYKSDLLDLVKAEKENGLTEKDGLQGNLRDSVHSAAKLIKTIYTNVSKDIEDKIVAEKLKANIITVVLIIMIILLSLSITKYINNSLSKFQNGILRFFQYLNKEVSTVELLDDKENNEIGIMAKVVNQNISKTKTLLEEDKALISEVKNIVNKVKNGHFKQKVNSTTQNQELEELKISLNDMLENIASSVTSDMNKIEKILAEFQKLNFSNRIPNATGKIAIALNKLAEIINDMLIENKSNGLTLQNSADMLEENVQSLSSASNQAAASLEETAAALEEITSNITNNTQNVVQMASHGNEVKKSVSSGQKLASRTTKAMDEINDEVTSISEAIAVIDQIAFQTNILSLNAAVEAATAGEAGKGFAVVAQEVRNLASRSAEAANEIKAIVQNATNKADNGKSIASQMIDGYEHLNDSITKTLNLIDDVEMASKEQLHGIEQINDAVSAIDQQTQQNANVANITKDIATQTQHIAHSILEDANEKEFIGKNSVKAKNIDHIKHESNRKVSNSIPKATQPKKQIKIVKKQKSTIKPIVSNSSDDEWASF